MDEMERLIKEEEKKMKRLKFIVDLTQAILMQANLSIEEAIETVNQTKKAILNLFPDKENTYELIYAPRFRRIIAERFTIPGTLSGRN
jgi:predicted deacetylase